MRLAASRWHLPAAVLRFVPNVYSPPPALLALPLERAPLAVGFFGRLEALKGIVDLAAAWPRVLARCPGATLRLVGRPMPLPESRGLADAEFRRVAGPACAAVEFRGHRPLAEIPAEFAHVSVSVIPSHWENFPGVCLEAMAAGCGIVGTSVGGLPEMLSGERGLVVPPRDPARLAEAILTLLLDRPCRLALAARARASVRDDYSPARIAPLVESAYADAIARRPALR